MMKGVRIAGIALLAAGALSLLFGVFTYTKDAYRLHVGDLQLTVKDRETVHIPIWVSLGSLAAGGVLLVVPRRTHGV
jgi:hypothetical protein